MAVIATVLPLAGAAVLVAFAARLAPWLRDQGLFGMAGFVAAFSVLGGLALVPTWANSILGGWVYHRFIIGFPIVMAGLGGAAIISYGLARLFGGHRVEDLIHRHRKWEVVRQALIGRGPLRTTWLVILVRLSPLLPFETTSVLLAVTGVRPLPFLIGTLIGIAPRCAAIVMAATGAEHLDLHARGGKWMLLAGAAATVAGAAIIALISKHALARATRK
jgi:uncharacterized membrane protein YdjX (TVP38/TMEM64 family)